MISCYYGQTDRGVDVNFSDLTSLAFVSDLLTHVAVALWLSTGAVINTAAADSGLTADTAAVGILTDAN